MNEPATFHVQLLPSGLRFDAPASASLLAAAEAAGIALPNSCRNGTCRTCLCQLEEGSVRYLIDWPGLTREERAAGAILPCVALATSDLTLTATAKAPATVTGTATVTSTEVVTGTVTGTATAMVTGSGTARRAPT